jgi:ketosteroid isomerase-like protein
LDLDNYGPVPVRDYDYVVCSKCGSEFQPHVKECIDCGAPTVPPGAARTPREEEPEKEAAAELELPLSQDPEVTVLYTGGLLWAEELKKRCEAQGIPGWIEEEPMGSGEVYRLYVPRRNFKRAHDIDRQYLQEEVPEVAGLAEVPPPGICPFCHQRLPAGALECPGCGLVLAVPDDAPAATSNLEIVQALYAALGEGDGDRVLEILDPQVEWIQNEGFPGGGRFVGAEAVYEKVFNRLADEWEGWGAEVGRWLEAGDSVVALGAYRGTCRKTGKSMRAAFAHIYWLYDGRIVSFEQYADTAKVAAACAK